MTSFVTGAYSELCRRRTPQKAPYRSLLGESNRPKLVLMELR